jgi:hypothetical protein
VPVLSKTIVRILRADSRGAPPLIKIPFDAPTPGAQMIVFKKASNVCFQLPVETITAVGVANPRAHGHAIDRTVSA